MQMFKSAPQAQRFLSAHAFIYGHFHPRLATEHTGGHQVSDPRAMPVDAYVSEVMQLLGRRDHPRGEVLVERDIARRWAERDGRYNVAFAAINPS